MAESKSEDNLAGDHGAAGQGTGGASYVGGGPSVSDEDRTTALRAAAHFEAGEYDKCLSTLGTIASTRPKDHKLVHNRAVVEFYRSGQKKIDLLKRVLKDVCAKMYPDGVIDGLDAGCIMYNSAVLLYHTKQYRSAWEVLHRLEPFIDPIEDIVSQKIVLLLAELCILIHDPESALEKLSILEKHFTASDKASSDKEDDRGGRGGSLEGERGGRGGSTEPQLDANRTLLCQLRMKCYLMLKSIKSAKRELKSLTNCSEPSLAVLFTKARYEAVRFNFQKSFRILTSSPQLLNLPTDPPAAAPASSSLPVNPSLLAVYYNNVAVTQFYQRKHHLGLFNLRKALEENNKATKLGRKPEDPLPPLPRMSSSHYYELMYNLGVQSLHVGQPQAAFDHLLEVVQVYHTNPRLWLRLAECCIMCHRQSNDDDRKIKKKMEVIKCSVGSGIHRKIILGSGVTNDSVSSGNEAAIPVATMEFASLCVDNALLLIPETLPGGGAAATAPTSSVSKSNTADTSLQDPATTQSASTPLVAALPGAPMRMEEVENLRCSALAARSYIALYHNDHLVALQYAERLLRQSRLSGAHRYLAHQYCAEALVALDRISEGVDHLNLDAPTDVSTLFPSPGGSTVPGGSVSQSSVASTTSADKSDASDVYEPKGVQLYPWSPSDSRPARAITSYNLATAYAIRGEHDKALHHLVVSTQDAGGPLPAQMYYLKIYVELTEGRRKQAQSFIKDQFGHMALSKQ